MITKTGREVKLVSKRTTENCGLMKRYGQAEVKDGKCLGFAKSEHDDEPCETCKKCKLQQSYESDSY